MKNLVFESLDELFEAKQADEKEDKPKARNVHSEKAKTEKTKAIKLKDQSKAEKAKQAIAALKSELAKAKKPGAYKTLSQKKAKVEEIEQKIKSWEKKLSECSTKK